MSVASLEQLLLSGVTRNKLVKRRPGIAPFSLVVGASRPADELRALALGLDPNCFLVETDGTFVGLDIELGDPLPVYPEPVLAQRWNNALLCESVRDTSDVVAAGVVRARDERLAGLEVIDETCITHEEALDFTLPDNVDKGFFYLDDPLHRRRVRMLADVVAAKLRRIVAENGSARVLELGVGLSVISRAAIELLDERTRRRVHFAAIDVSEDLLRYGLMNHWLDEGIVANAATTPIDELAAVVGSPDIFIAAEVLEHIRASASVFERTLAPWLRRSGSYFVGSVPNSVQGVEMLALADADHAPHQLTRPLFDEGLDHVAFYTYPTLRQALTETWNTSDTSIWGNGLRLDRSGSTLCLDAGLKYPHRSDRLCFATQF